MMLRILVCSAPYLFAVMVSCGLSLADAKRHTSDAYEAERDEMALKLKDAELSLRDLNINE